MKLFLGLAFWVGSFAFAMTDLEKETQESAIFLDKEAAVAKTEKLENGILYRETKAGFGVNPGMMDTVTVNYKGSLRNGKVFDSGKGTSFGLMDVISCWTKAIQKMKPGGSAVIFCPASTAYGDRGTGADIKGGAALKFEVTLLKIAK